ncbi:cell envelope integrity protein TolA [Variovorax sp. V15]|uniref:cell envelope integrity protein TolA n=1 Tax=Variovorax sp. V15 TaxID=3065952 RepID=UPI0034E84E31
MKSSWLILVRALSLLFALSGCELARSDQTFKIVDGQLVVINSPSALSYDIGSPVGLPIQPYYDPAKGAAGSGLSSIRRLADYTNTTLGYYVEASRMANAREAAENKIKDKLNAGNRSAAVIVSADAPLDLGKKPDRGNFLNRYYVSDAISGQNSNAVLTGMLGRGEPELFNELPADQKQINVLYPRYMLLGETDANGISRFRVVTPSEQDQVVQRAHEAEVARRNAIAEEAAKARQQAEQLAQEKKTKDAKEAAEANKKREEQARRDAAEAERSRNIFRNLIDARTDACAGGRGSSACTYADDKVTNYFDKQMSYRSIARCQQTEAGVGPGGGQGRWCGSKAPPCIFCSVRANSQVFSQYQNGLAKQLIPAQTRY